MSKRQIVLDTETTGFDAAKGERLVEIAAIELLDGAITGKTYQQYINPQRESNPGALRVHGLTTEFLADKPLFADIAKTFLDFVKDAELIMHNAPFDISFLNAELKLVGEKEITDYCPNIIDTVYLAKRAFAKEFLVKALLAKGCINDEAFIKDLRMQGYNDEKITQELTASSKFRALSLDHLCQYYDINLTKREKNHGALIDCELLAAMYTQLKNESPHLAKEVTHLAQTPLQATSIFKPQQPSPDPITAIPSCHTRAP